MGSKRHVVKVFYKYSDHTVEVVDSVSVINLNFNWITTAFKKLKSYWTKLDD